MKKILILTAAASMMLAVGCSDDNFFGGEGQGRVIINPTVNTDMAVVSRSTEAELEAQYAESTMIWISSSKGLIRRYNSLSELPAEPLVLNAGSYVAEGWCGDSVPASFTDRWFKAYVPFTVTDGGTTTVPLALKIANVAVSVQYDDAVAEVLRDCKMTVGHTGGSLEFAGETESNRGYFMMPSTATGLNYKLEATQMQGTPFELTGVVEDVKPATEYVLHVKYNADETELGGAYFTISVDEQEIVVEKEVELIVAPRFTGYGFDIAKPINCESGAVGRRTVYVTSAARITSLEIMSDQLTAMIGGPDVQLFGMTEAVRQNLANAGINYVDGYYNEAESNTLLQINFESTYTDALENGEYTFEMKATDEGGRVSTATLVFNISDAPVAAVQLPAGDLNTYTNRATVSATMLKEGAAEVGIRYRKSGISSWNAVAAEGTYAVGETYSVTLTGLEAGTEYEYAAYADEYTSPALTFTTDAAAQLPNAGFEDWDTSSKTYLVYAPGQSMFWDSGNHGATTMGSSITTPDGDLKHSGNYSAKLYSKFVGIMGIGKFAAGNMFAGKYLATDKTDGILGWGRPFTGRPTAVKVYAKYTPGTVQSNAAVSGYFSTGDTDQGIIYMALTDDTRDSYAYSGTTYSWPVVVRTASGDRRLFDRNEDRVIAYGEHLFETATAGDGLIEITIPIEYYRTDVRPSNIIFVASASRYGDYFCGGEGSTLWIDDIELIYE